MSDDSKAVAIGAFVVGAAVIAISAMLFISSTGWGNDKSKVIMVFDGSVKGLSIGAPVTLQGVQIGQITDIHLNFDAKTVNATAMIEAEISHQKLGSEDGRVGIFPKAMLTKGLHAQLYSQSLLTGLLYVQLEFQPETKVKLAKIDSPYLQIPTAPTDLQRITQALESMDFVGLVKDIRTIAEGLGQVIVAESFQNLPADLHSTLSSVAEMTMLLEAQINSTGPKLNRVLDSTAKTMRILNSEIPKLSATAGTSLVLLNRAIGSFEATMLSVNMLVSDDSATIYGLKQALREVAQAGRELQLLAKTLEEHPEALIRGLRKDSE